MNFYRGSPRFFLVPRANHAIGGSITELLRKMEPKELTLEQNLFRSVAARLGQICEEQRLQEKVAARSLILA